MVRSAVAVVVTLLIATACGQNDTSTETITGIACDSPDGSWTNLSDEPAGFRDLPDLVTWTDSAGCLINAEFLFHRMADDHCGWEDVEVIAIGLPVMTPFTGPDAIPPGQDWEPEFVFNTRGLLSSEPAGVEFPIADLPTDAIDLDLRGNGDRRMYIAADETTLWVTQGDTVRTFVRPLAEVACA